MDETTNQTLDTSANDDWDVDISDIEISDDEAETESEVTATEEEANQAEAETQENTDGTDNAETEQTKPDVDTKADQSFTLKYLGEEKAVNRDEVVALAQKGMDYDRQKAKYDTLLSEKETIAAEKAKADETLSFLAEIAKQQGLTTDELIDNTKATIIAEKEGLAPDIALARVKLERREMEIKKREEKLNSATATETAQKDAEAAEKARVQNDINAFVSKYPSVDPKTIPKEVWEAFGKGANLVSAYIEHENARLKLELEATKKNEENKSKSTGSRSTAGQTKMSAIDALWYDGT